MKVKVQQAIKVKDVFFDEEGRRCEKERVEIVELDQEVPPDTTAGIFWLKTVSPNNGIDRLQELKMMHIFQQT